MHWNEAVSDDEYEEADADSESNKPLRKLQQSFLSEEKSVSRKLNDSAILGFPFNAAGLIMTTLSRESSSIFKESKSIRICPELQSRVRTRNVLNLDSALQLSKPNRSQQSLASRPKLLLQVTNRDQHQIN
jgi:hypothetical protein